MQIMWSKRAIQTLNDELSNATAKATELADRKRKAADAAAEGFNLNATARLTRQAGYATKEKRNSPSCHRSATSVY
jgi:hypothetical protein